MTGLRARQPGPAHCASTVAIGIADFLVRTETERVRLFRKHLEATVTRVSPLLPALAATEGLSLAGAVKLILPPEDWPWRPLFEFPPGLARRAQHYKVGPGSSAGAEIARFRRAFAKPGLILRDAGHERGRFAIRPVGAVLGFTAALGPCLLTAFGTSALLKLPYELPETLSLALPGRPLEQLIQHPIFEGRGYFVSRVQPCLSDRLPVVMFRAPLVGFRVPWAQTGFKGAV